MWFQPASGRRVRGSAVRLPQRSLRSEDGCTAEAALPLGQGSGRLAGRGLAGAFPQGGSGPRLWGAGVCDGAGGRCRKADGMGRVRKGGSLTPLDIFKIRNKIQVLLVFLCR